MDITGVVLSLEDTLRKLNAVSLAEDISDNIKNKMSTEIQALDWAVSYIKSNMIDAVLIIGHPEFVNPLISDITEMNRHQVTDMKSGEYQFTTRSDDLATLLILNATDYITKMCHESYNPDSLDGNLLPKDAILDYVICNRFYGSQDVDDQSKKVLFFTVSIREEYVRKGKELAEWGRTIFKNVNWDPS